MKQLTPQITFCCHGFYVYTSPWGGGGGVFSKTLYRKTVRENMDEDIFKKTIFSWAHMEERKELETGLTCCRSQKKLRGGRRRKATAADGWALEALVNRAFKPNNKITTISPLLPAHSFLYNIFRYFRAHTSSSPFNIKEVN